MYTQRRNRYIKVYAPRDTNTHNAVAFFSVDLHYSFRQKIFEKNYPRKCIIRTQRDRL